MKNIFCSVLFGSLLVGSVSSQVQATGLLIPKDRGLSPLGIKYHRATVKITDRVAVTHVDQVFVNPTNRDLEATYVFPLPKGATVSDFYLYVNGRRTKGEILEKNRARNIYEGIVRRMQDPGLVEYLGRDLFQCRVYPVPKHSEQRLEIEFSQLLPYQAGVITYTYPMRTDRASAKTLQDFTMSVSIHSKTGIKTVYSPSHQIYSRKKDDHHALAGFEKNQALLDRDFELLYTVSDKAVGLNLLTYREASEPGFFLLMASPKSDFQQREIIGKHISFVIDSSGSMAGAKMTHAKQALQYCLAKLNPDDRFNVIRFSTDVEAFEKVPVSASKKNIERAQNFVKRMQAAGGTAIAEALQTAIANHTNADEPNLIVFLTDGHPTVGVTEPKTIIEQVVKGNRVNAKIFVFGVGDEINTHLLDKISSENGANSTYVKPNQEITKMLEGFYDKVSHPVLTQLKLDFGKIHEYDVLPKKLPDLFKGSQLIVLGRYRDDGHSALVLTGKAGKESKKFVFEGSFPKESRSHDFIPRLWATRKIGYLLDNIRLGGERQELVNEVITLSKRYGIVTPYTSYLVTEDTPQVALRRAERPRFGRPPIPRPGPVMDAKQAASRVGGARPMKRKSRQRYRVMAKSSSESLHFESGEQAVHMADAVKELKDAQGNSADSDELSGIRYRAGHAFRYMHGVWTDLKFERNKTQLLKVKYLSKAYFQLMKRSALLKKIFAVGDRLIVMVGTSTAIEVGPQGHSQLTSSQLSTFCP